VMLLQILVNSAVTEPVWGRMVGTAAIGVRENYHFMGNICKVEICF
jgi:hypothetical protein